MTTSRTSSRSSPAIWASVLAACFASPAWGQPIGADETSRRLVHGAADASGEIACAQITGQAMGVCAARVVRGPDGRASVRVAFANGFSRVLHFDGGAFVRASSTMSGVGTDTDWTLEDGTHRVRVEGQRYELPHDLVFAE